MICRKIRVVLFFEKASFPAKKGEALEELRPMHKQKKGSVSTPVLRCILLSHRKNFCIICGQVSWLCRKPPLPPSRGDPVAKWQGVGITVAGAVTDLHRVPFSFPAQYAGKPVNGKCIRTCRRTARFPRLCGFGNNRRRFAKALFRL